MNTIVAFSTWRAIRSATSHAPPDEMPPKMPSSRRQPARHRFGRGLAHVLDAIDAAAVEDLRQIGFRPLADARNARAFLRLRADDLDRLDSFPSDSCDTPMIVPVVPIAETKCVMRPSVSRQISGPGRLRSATRGLSGFANWSRMMPLPSRCICSARSRAYSMPPVTRRQHDLRAEGRHALTALDRQVLRHDQHHLVAAHRGRHRERDAGVAARGFDQRVARLDAAALFGLLDHRRAPAGPSPSPPDCCLRACRESRCCGCGCRRPRDGRAARAAYCRSCLRSSCKP